MAVAAGHARVSPLKTPAGPRVVEALAIAFPVDEREIAPAVVRVAGIAGVPLLGRQAAVKANALLESRRELGVAREARLRERLLRPSWQLPHLPRPSSLAWGFASGPGENTWAHAWWLPPRLMARRAAVIAMTLHREAAPAWWRLILPATGSPPAS